MSRFFLTLSLHKNKECMSLVLHTGTYMPQIACHCCGLPSVVKYAHRLSFHVCRGIRTPDMSPRRLSDISPQLQQLKSLVVDDNSKEELRSSRSVEPINNTSIEERILRIAGYYGCSGKRSNALTFQNMKPYLWWRTNVLSLPTVHFPGIMSLP